MRIAGIYSFNKGKEAIMQQHRTGLDEVLQVIGFVDAECCKAEISKEKTMRDKVSYSPSALNEAFKAEFASRGWLNQKVIAEYSKDYYVAGYTPPVRKRKRTSHIS